MTQKISDQPIHDFVVAFNDFNEKRDKDTMKKCIDYAMRMVVLFSQSQQRSLRLFHDPLYNPRPLISFLRNAYDALATKDAFCIHNHIHVVSVLDAMNVGIVGRLMLDGHDLYFQTLHATLQNYLMTGDTDHLYITKSVIDVLAHKYVGNTTE